MLVICLIKENQLKRQEYLCVNLTDLIIKVKINDH